MTRGTCVAIVGLGSRGLSVLERIVTLAGKLGPAAGQVKIEIIYPTCTGSGVHDTAQPDYLLLNTTCSKVSMFPDSCTVGLDVDQPGPILYEWVSARGLRLGDDGYTVSEVGRRIRPTDFLPRRVLGEYLGWFLGQVQRRVPGQVRLRLHRATAVDIDPAPAGSHRPGGLAVVLSDNSRVEAQCVFLTTGYTPNDTGCAGGAGTDRMISEPYPLPEQTAPVAPGESIAINGFRLSAMDLMSCLTVGRGGRYAGNPDRLSYVPSGSEPTLLFYSRSGVPCRARPLITEFGPKYEPLVFTEAGIDRLRISRDRGLDFDADVLPLILTEMRVAYRRRAARCGRGDTELALMATLTKAAEMGRLTAVLDELDSQLGPFDARAEFDGSAEMLRIDAAAYQQWLADTIARDLAEGLLGFERSPVKAALDILRELRDTVRYAVDFGGLSHRSLDDFNRRIVPLMNRAVVGPQYERHSELLALMAAGVAYAPFGPAPAVCWNQTTGAWRVSSTKLGVPYTRDADWLVSARVPLPAVASSASPLISALHRKGWIRPHLPGSDHVNGVDVNAHQHPLDAHGSAIRRLWVLGPLCEGATFYNNLVPSPSTYSRPVFDAHRCVAAMFAAARSEAEPDLATGRPARTEVPI